MKATATNMRIGNMAGLTGSHWADEMLLGFSSGGRKLIGQHIFTRNIISLSGIGSRADEAMNPATSPMLLRYQQA